MQCEKRERKAVAMLRAGASYDLIERVTGVDHVRLVEILYGRPLR